MLVQMTLALVFTLGIVALQSSVAAALPSGVELLKADHAGDTEKRALIIGNADYRNVPKLRNAEADAVSMAHTVQRLGFETYLARNLDRRAMNDAVTVFLQRIEPHSEVLVYYAGHGVEVQGANYLLPVDIPALDPEQARLLRSEGLNLTELMQDIESRSARMSLVILDACRENPFPRQGTRSLGARGGLASIEAPRGSFIIFAAGVGELALDNLGPNDRDPNGLFTRRLLALMNEEGLELRSLVRRLRNDVSEAAQALAGRSQMPSYYDQMRGEFYFRPPRIGVEAPQTECDRAIDPLADRAAVRKVDLDTLVRVCATAVESHPNEPRLRRLLQAAQDQRAYVRAVGSKERGMSIAYLEFFPNGRFIEDVRQHLASLSPPAPAPESVPAPTSTQHATRDCAQCPEMVSIPLGSFEMGASTAEEVREKVHPPGLASPQRKVTVSQPFALSRFEITRAQYSAFVNATGRTSGRACRAPDANGFLRERADANWRNPGFRQSDSDPVVCVSWDDAQAFAAWLSKLTRKTYRLPSEAEWEYAARAGSSGSRPWGNDVHSACRFENVHDAQATTSASRRDPDRSFQCSDGFPYTAPVGKLQANAFGLHDMLGNVQEWVEDCWNENYVGASDRQEARRSGICTLRTLRGGSWYVSETQDVRSASRGFIGSQTYDSTIGFRVARSD